MNEPLGGCAQSVLSAKCSHLKDKLRRLSLQIEITGPKANLEGKDDDDKTADHNTQYTGCFFWMAVTTSAIWCGLIWSYVIKCDQEIKSNQM